MYLNTISTSQQQRSKKKNITLMIKPMFDYLPYEIVWQILILIPAQDLFDNTMLVCKSWYELINTQDFRYAHLRRSTPGHLIKRLQYNPVLYMTSFTRDNIIALSHHGHNFMDYYFWSSCNGLVLGSTYGNENTAPHVIKNPVTKQRVTLPPFFPLTTAESPTQTSAIAYAATSMKYKVIATSCVDAKRQNYARFCAVLTVGVDTEWRLLDARHLSFAGSEILSWDPFVTEGFVHWAHLSGTCIVSVNVETENITEVQIPWYYHPRGIKNYYFPVGGGSSYLCVLIGLDYFKWEVWEMKPETGVWTKMPGNIDLVAQKRAINRYFSKRVGSIQRDGFDWRLFPVCWLKYGEVIFFALTNPEQSGRFRAAYNLRTGDIRCYDMGDIHEYPYLLHTNTLIRI